MSREAVVLTRRPRSPWRWVVVIALLASLSTFAVESAAHSVHHLLSDEQDQQSCPIAVASERISAVDPGIVVIDAAPATAVGGPLVEQPEFPDRPPACPHRDRAPPSAATA
jgi:hypothetical protein